MNHHTMTLVLVAFALAATCRPGSENDHHTDHQARPQTVTVVAREMAFEPGDLHLQAGQPVSVEFVNAGLVPHDWNVLKASEGGDQPGAHAGHRHANAESGANSAAAEHRGHRHAVGADQLHVMAGPGERARVEFGALASGQYEYFCSVPGHREAGMVGRVFVH